MGSISKFLNKISITINALKVMALPGNFYELIVTQLLVSKLDPNTSKRLKELLSNVSFPDFEGLIEFFKQ